MICQRCSGSMESQGPKPKAPHNTLYKRYSNKIKPQKSVTLILLNHV